MFGVGEPDYALCLFSLVRMKKCFQKSITCLPKLCGREFRGQTSLAVEHICSLQSQFQSLASLVKDLEVEGDVKARAHALASL